MVNIPTNDPSFHHGSVQSINRWVELVSFRFVSFRFDDDDDDDDDDARAKRDVVRKK